MPLDDFYGLDARPTRDPKEGRPREMSRQPGSGPWLAWHPALGRRIWTPGRTVHGRERLAQAAGENGGEPRRMRLIAAEVLPVRQELDDQDRPMAIVGSQLGNERTQPSAGRVKVLVVAGFLVQQRGPLGVGAGLHEVGRPATADHLVVTVPARIVDDDKVIIYQGFGAQQGIVQEVGDELDLVHRTELRRGHIGRALGRETTDQAGELVPPPASSRDTMSSMRS